MQTASKTGTAEHGRDLVTLTAMLGATACARTSAQGMLLVENG